MRLRPSYYRDHGWYLGRPLKWVAMLALGVAALGLGILWSFAAKATCEHHFYLFWFGPVTTLFLAARVARRKRNGEPFYYSPPQASWFKKIGMSHQQRHEDRWAGLQVVEKTKDPSLYFKLAVVESCMRLSVLGLQLLLLSLFFSG